MTGGGEGMYGGTTFCTCSTRYENWASNLTTKPAHGPTTRASHIALFTASLLACLWSLGILVEMSFQYPTWNNRTVLLSLECVIFLVFYSVGIMILVKEKRGYPLMVISFWLLVFDALISPVYHGCRPFHYSCGSNFTIFPVCTGLFALLIGWKFSWALMYSVVAMLSIACSVLMEESGVDCAFGAEMDKISLITVASNYIASIIIALLVARAWHNQMEVQRASLNSTVTALIDIVEALNTWDLEGAQSAIDRSPILDPRNLNSAKTRDSLQGLLDVLETFRPYIPSSVLPVAGDEPPAVASPSERKKTFESLFGSIGWESGPFTNPPSLPKNPSSRSITSEGGSAIKSSRINQERAPSRPSPTLTMGLRQTESTLVAVRLPQTGDWKGATTEELSEASNAFTRRLFAAAEANRGIVLRYTGSSALVGFNLMTRQAAAGELACRFAHHLRTRSRHGKENGISENLQLAELVSGDSVSGPNFWRGTGGRGLPPVVASIVKRQLLCGNIGSNTSKTLHVDAAATSLVEGLASFADVTTPTLPPWPSGRNSGRFTHPSYSPVTSPSAGPTPQLTPDTVSEHKPPNGEIVNVMDVHSPVASMCEENQERPPLVIMDSATQESVVPRCFTSRPFDRLHFSPTDLQTLVGAGLASHESLTTHELLHPITHVEDEWMYQIEAASGEKGKWDQQFLDAWMDLVKGRFEDSTKAFTTLAQAASGAAMGGMPGVSRGPGHVMREDTRRSLVASARRLAKIAGHLEHTDGVMQMGSYRRRFGRCWEDFGPQPILPESSSLGRSAKVAPEG